MPDKDGWHDLAFTGSDGRQYRWHYCRAAATDAMVLDTPQARSAHVRDCTRLARAAAKRAKREADKAFRAGEARYRREKKLEKAVIG